MIKNRKGFTLIELLLVVAIIAILAVVVFVALNPAKRLKDSKDSRRATDIQNILTAVHAYIVDNSGSYPAGLTAGMAETQIGTAVGGGAIATGGCNVTATPGLNLITPLSPYLKSLPVDPSGSAALTKYSIVVDTNGIVTVKACGAENTTLSVSQ